MKNEIENETPAFNPDDVKIINELPEIAGAIIDDRPEPTESAIEAQATAEVQKPTIDAPGATGDAFKVDTDGVSFNADIHQVDASGKPRIGINGLLMKKRGRKKGGSNTGAKSTIAGSAVASGSSGELPLTESQRQQAAITGSVSADMLINLSMLIGGEDFKPEVNTASGVDERKALESAFTSYYIATRKVDFPPGAALLVVISFYVLPRFQKPKVQTHIKEKTSRIYNWWQNRKLKKKGKKDGAHIDTGDDGKRENDTSKESSANLQS